jgi:hypothetical protein
MFPPRPSRSATGGLLAALGMAAVLTMTGAGPAWTPARAGSPADAARPYTLHDAERDAVLRALQAEMRDPASASVSGLEARQHPARLDAVDVCGFFSGRGGDGVMRGPFPFHASLSLTRRITMEDGVTLPRTLIAGIGSSDTERTRLACDLCALSGMPICPQS